MRNPSGLLSMKNPDELGGLVSGKWQQLRPKTAVWEHASRANFRAALTKASLFDEGGLVA